MVSEISCVSKPHHLLTFRTTLIALKPPFYKRVHGKAQIALFLGLENVRK